MRRGSASAFSASSSSMIVVCLRRMSRDFSDAEVRGVELASTDLVDPSSMEEPAEEEEEVDMASCVVVRGRKRRWRARTVEPSG